MNKNLMKAIIFVIALNFVAIAFASAIPNNNLPTSDTTVSSYNVNSMLNSNVRTPGNVQYTIFPVNNSLRNGNVLATSLGGQNPTYTTYDPLSNTIYVDNANVNGVSLLNGTTGNVTGSIDIGAYPQSSIYDAATGNVYVMNEDNNNISIINGSFNKLTGNISLGSNLPNYAALDTLNGELYVSNLANSTVLVVNLTEKSITNTINVGSEQNKLAFDPANGYLYVADASPYTYNVSVINTYTNSFVKNLSTGQEPFGAVYVPNNGNIYVTNVGSYNISIINGTSNKAIGSINLSQPDSIAFDQTNSYLYVSGANNVSVFNITTDNFVTSITVGSSPEGISIDSQSGNIFVANIGESSAYTQGVSIINQSTNTLYKTVFMGVNPNSLSVDTSQGSLLVSENYPSDISVVNTSTNTVSKTIDLGASPIYSTFNAKDALLYTLTANPNTDSYFFTVINASTEKSIRSIPIPNDPSGMAFDPANGNLYVTAYSYPESSIYIINGTSGIMVSQTNVNTGNFELFSSPIYDPANSMIYILNLTNGNLTGTNGSTISNVTYYYNSGTFDPLTGNIYLNAPGFNLLMVINATTGEPVTFVGVGNDPVSSAFDPQNGYLYVTNSGSNNVTVVDGSTNQVVGNISVGKDPVSAVYSPSNGYIYVANENSGTVSVISTTPYKVTLKQTGLPAGTTWYVNLSNGQNFTSTGSNMSFNETNGTYSFTLATNSSVYTPSMASGSFDVNGNNVTESLSFVKVTYSVNFDESGLLTGTDWYVNLSNGQSYSSKSSSANFTEPNGTYHYSISTVNKTYTPVISSGSLVVSGSNLTVNVTFKQVIYNVTFTELGLPNGTQWYVNLSNGQSFASTNNTLSFLKENGTFSYNVTSVNVNYPKLNGTFTVNGKNLSVNANFSTNKNETSPSSGNPPVLLYGAVGAVATISVVGTAGYIVRRKR